jgi:pyruvate dehydrogenase E1 component alpha subunit/2-oxoisovalerate dehydrogenase E1 component alpha subunit
MYRAMSMSRLMDERMMRLQRQGRIGFYGTASGEEAAVVGSSMALEDEDWVFPALRQGAAALMRGMPLEVFIAQCIGNSMDVAKGRQMPVHASYRAANFVSWGSCIGTQMPHAVGMAYAAKHKGDSAVAMAYMGDGATSEGDFHVALNFAGVYKSPVVFFCQNNQWAISVPLDQQTASRSIAVKAEGYGFEGVQVDGNDVLKVFQVTKKAVEKAREGGGPTLIEAVTYRLGSHSSSDDPTRYRPEGEMESWQAKDPIIRLRHFMEEKKLWTEDKQSEMMASLNDAFSEAVKKAEAAPPLDSKTLFDDVYANPPAQLLKQAESQSKFPPAPRH